jgi:N6-adenosine-specific RNA methylase IME4
MNLPNKKYNIIYADPAWNFNNWSKDPNVKGNPNKYYKTMSIEDIKKLPVKEIADDNCILFLWVTDPQLNLQIPVIESWGFQFKTVGFYWIKKNKTNDNFFKGMGYWGRSNIEQCLLATKGRIKRIGTNVEKIVVSERREHSRKPDCIRDKIIELCGDLPRIELFARQKVDGWDCWGNEV